ncbi:hypothetical protein FOL47_002978 [Perkinsus chesapeaki]|uniref:Uncharacterized protein n=1 Tax=Perkinsus chesapeaki TaxID=330153 RepID=A0A7J6MAV7_PERCH|nr:hypothetical protein FOL47_002978 [Perkinsus chesapeaki]
MLSATRILSPLLLVISVFGGLLDKLPAKYCIEISYGSSLKKLYVRHEVTIPNNTTMEYQQYNWRWFAPWWRNKRGLKDVPMHYNPCADAPQPFVMDRDFHGFYFTKQQFAAMLHYDKTDELQLIINNVPRLLSRCNGESDDNLRKVETNSTDANVQKDMSN